VFLKLFDNVSYIVTMLSRVILDLGAFLLFFAILIFLFANIFNVVGLANYKLNDIPGVRENALKALWDYADA
jgi:hypothetical protein